MAPISQFEALGATVGDTVTDIFTATDDCYFIQLDITGPASVGVQVEIIVHRISTATDYVWLNRVPLPLGSTLQVLEGSKLVLKTGDIIRARCVTPGESIDIQGSYVDKVNL